MRIFFLLLLLMSCTFPPKKTDAQPEGTVQEAPIEEPEKTPKKPQKPQSGIASSPAPPKICPEQPIDATREQILKALDCLIKIKKQRP